MPAVYICSRLEHFFKVGRRKYFSFQNALGYPWHRKFLQRWRCNSGWKDWLLVLKLVNRTWVVSSRTAIIRFVWRLKRCWRRRGRRCRLKENNFKKGHFRNSGCTPGRVARPILRLLNLQLQRQRCGRLERFSTKKKCFCFHNELGYSWRCKKLQRWRCKSKS
jgi:hypothetical protein